MGQSTAGAIVAMGLHGYGVICDGNVKRVMTRWAGIDGDIMKSATTKQLWELAERLTPASDSGHYAQAMMDMGATLCTRRNPQCELCPVNSDCIAHAQGREMDYPVKAKKKPKPSRFSNVLLIENSKGELLWLQRPDSGIWGGLWVLPLIFEKKLIEQQTKGRAILTTLTTAQNDDVYDNEFTVAEQIVHQWLEQYQLHPQSVSNSLLDDAPIKHSLTHFHWYLQPQQLTLNAKQAAELTQALENADINLVWADSAKAQATLGLPKAMVKVLESV